MQLLNKNAPKLIDYLDEASKKHFEQLKLILDACGIEYTVNPCLVRGLDYYCKTVFEWVTDALGAQGTVCAGGHYDTLVEQLGGPAVPAIGFAMGFERIISLLMDTDAKVSTSALDIFFITLDEQYYIKALEICEMIRETMPKINCYFHAGGGSLKSQMKKANKSEAQLAFILGEDEFNNHAVTIKPLRDNLSEQQAVKEQYADRTLVACLELHTYSSLNAQFLKEYKGSLHE